MDLNEIKTKYRNRGKADIKDLELVLEALPFLVREVESLEKQLSESEKRIEHLSGLMKRKPPLNKEGEKGQSKWKASVDEKRNRLYVELSGKFDYRSAKMASNSIISVIPNLRANFDIINDISKIDLDYDKKALFHMKKVMYSLEEIGVKRVVRVVNEETSDIFHVFERISKEVGINTTKATSMTEAEEMLENVSQFLKT